MHGLEWGTIFLASILSLSSLPLNSALVQHATFKSCCLHSFTRGGMCPSMMSESKRQGRTNLRMAETEMSVDEIKRELEAYLEKRREINADLLAKQEKGKVIGGTKGNKVLEFMSVAPSKESMIERIPNVFDYSELTKYGYSNLVTPIMEMGGRQAVYDLMGMERPAIQRTPKKPKTKDLVLDRTGEEDSARFKGLSMGRLDDDAMGEALARASEKSKKGESLRPKLMEEGYEIPYSDIKTTGNPQLPEWTPEALDAYTRRQGQTIDFIRQSQREALVKDPDESLNLPLAIKFYFVFAMLEICFAFGKSTSPFLKDFIGFTDESIAELLSVLQAPGLALGLASIGSMIVCGWILAPPLNRSTPVWAIKGLLGGPVAVRQLRGLEMLITREQLEQKTTRQD